ncbi:MAG: protein kinase [Gemmataceae bacterium]|nr:protein kinase [Gemmataceae bacterium]
MTAPLLACPRCESPLDAAGACPRCAVPSDTMPVSDRVPPDRTADGTGDFLRPPQKPDEIGRLGPYRVLDTLGQGGMGLVYRAEDEKLRRTVALKVMLPKFAASPQAAQRFLREARLQAAVEHDHVVPIYQADEADGIPFIAMPLLKGRTLADALKATPRLPASEALRIGREIAEGLAAAHATGLIHRDIKPANVWLEGDRRRVKILDFGLARAESSGEAETHITQEGAIVGTPAYMSPEQAAADELDPRTDLFSLGVVLYQMATGHLPFHGRNVTAVLTALTTKNPEAPRQHAPDLPPALDGLILKLLEKDRRNRPPSAQAVVDAIKLIEAGFDRAYEVVPVAAPAVVAAPDPSTEFAFEEDERTQFVSKEVPAPAKRAPRWPWIAGAAALVLILGIAVSQLLSKPKGTLVVDATDADLEVIVRRGDATVIAASRGREFPLAPGVGYSLDIANRKDTHEIAPERFEIRPNARTTVQVRMAKPIPKPKPKVSPIDGLTDEQREALNWVLAVGGDLHVAVDGQQQLLKGGLLPKTRFELLHVSLASVKEPELVILSNLRKMPPIENSLHLGNTAITGKTLDALPGMASMKDLRSLALVGTGVGSDLSALARLSQLRILRLEVTKIDDVGLVHLAMFPALESLDLRENGDRITNRGLDHLAKCRMLKSLSLQKTKVDKSGVEKLAAALPDCRIDWDGGIVEGRLPADPDRAGAEYALSVGGIIQIRTKNEDKRIMTIAELPQTTFELYYVDLLNSPSPRAVTDAGVAAFRGCKHISTLDVRGTAISDVGLSYFKECRKIESLCYTFSLVQGDALLAFEDLSFLKHLLPGGITDKSIAALNKSTHLERISLSGYGEAKYVSSVTDTGFSHLANCTSLRLLDIRDTPITDQGIKKISHYRNLVELNLINTMITSKGLAFLVNNVELQELGLSGSSNIDDEGIRSLRNCSKLRIVHLYRTKITDAALELLSRSNRELEFLQAEGTVVSDAGIKHLQTMPKLKEMNLKSTKVTQAGVDKLKAALPGCRIEWNGGVIEPTKK